MDKTVRASMNEWLSASIRVVGVGGAGSNAVDRMIQVGIPAVDFVATNTDSQALARSEATHKIVLGERFTKGLGAGGDPNLGAEAAKRSKEQLKTALGGAELVFIAAGMGGGTGTGASPVVAQVAREQGALTIAVVTRPFGFEGRQREAVADKGIKRLQEEVDTLVVVSNDHLLDVVNARVSLDIAFRIADEVLRQGIQGVSELVTQPGLINLDFADVRSIMGRGGGALISVGYGEGETRADQAAKMALGSPLLGIDSVKGADGLLVNVTGGDDLTLAEVDGAMKAISHSTMPHAEIIFGVVIDPEMENRMQITLIATGVGVDKPKVVRRVVEGSMLPFSAAMMADDDGAFSETVPAFMRSRAQWSAGARS